MRCLVVISTDRERGDRSKERGERQTDEDRDRKCACTRPKHRHKNRERVHESGHRPDRFHINQL